MYVPPKSFRNADEKEDGNAANYTNCKNDCHRRAEDPGKVGWSSHRTAVVIL